MLKDFGIDLNFVFFALLIMAVAVQLYYYIFYFSRLAFYKKAKPSDKNKKEEPVSVVICARDEEENLRKHLPNILEQDYPNYEVVVVNDGSVDDTKKVLETFSQQYPHLKVSELSVDRKFQRGKKFALTIGIKAASNNLLLLTDADCVPASNQWIRLMQQNFTDKKDIVIGYGAYKRKKGFLNKLIRFDTVFIAMQYLSFAIAKKPYMGVGRNLSYRKRLFFAQKGFASHIHIMSGDDDLFINEIANKKNVSIEINPQAHTLSEPKTSWQEWFFQKKRHLSTASYYKFSQQVHLGLIAISQFLFYITSIILLVQQLYFKEVLIIFAIRTVVVSLVLFLVMKQLNEKRLFFWAPLLDFIYIFVNPLIILANLISKNKQWR